MCITVEINQLRWLTVFTQSQLCQAAVGKLVARPFCGVAVYQLAKCNGHGCAVADHQHGFFIAVGRADTFKAFSHAGGDRGQTLAFGWGPVDVFVESFDQICVHGSDPQSARPPNHQ